MAKHSDRSLRPHKRKGLPDPSRKRTVTSCDICKGRKTKCIDLVPGPCKYCASISAKCTITIKRRQRPFYLVSEQEYRYGIDNLQKMLPETDLNMDTLRQLPQSMNSQQAGGTGTFQQAIALVGPPPQPSPSGTPSPEQVPPEIVTHATLSHLAIIRNHQRDPLNQVQVLVVTRRYLLWRVAYSRVPQKLWYTGDQ
ncbi:hypothetical protein BJX62DRAFT_219735 [Aspergillus germanicus]